MLNFHNLKFSLFSRLNNTTCVYAPPLLGQFLVIGYLGCFQSPSVVVNEIAVNIGMQISDESLISITLSVDPNRELLDHVISHLIFLVTVTQFSLMVPPFHSRPPISRVLIFQCP